MTIVQRLTSTPTGAPGNPRLPSSGLAGASHRFFVAGRSDAAGTAMAAILDDIGGALLAAVTSNPPTIQEDASDRWLSFDGTNDVLRMDYARTQPFTIAMVARVRTAGTYNLVQFANGGAKPMMIAGTANGYLDAGTAVAAVTPVANNAWHVIIATFDGANSRMTVDATTNTGNSGTATPIYLTLGTNGTSGYAPIDYKDIILWPFAATAANHTAIRAALKATHPGLP